MSRTAAIVLAAGLGTRFGGGKMLADVGGRPMLQRVLDLARAAELKPVVVVLGMDADDIEAAISWRGEVRVRNADPASGISSSLRIGLEAVGEAERVVVLLGDQPFLSLEQLDTIIATDRDPERPIVVPRYGDGAPGNPVLLEREAWGLVDRLEGDQGMVRVIRSEPTLVRYVEVAGTNPDIDSRSMLEEVATSPSRIRRQLNELTARDLEVYPIWEFALDEEGEPGQDETTVRPLPDERSARDFDVARATFMATDGTRFRGFVTPHSDRRPGSLQPTIVTDRGQVNFWLGWRGGGVRSSDISGFYDLLDVEADRLFPVRWELDVAWVGATDGSRRLGGTITGFRWFSDVEGRNEHEIR